jgi:hypothetical protein
MDADQAAARKFFSEEIEAKLMALIGGSYWLPKIQLYWNQRCAEILTRHKVPLNVNMSVVPAESDACFNVIPLGCGMVDGVPQATLFLPTIINSFLRLKIERSFNYRDVFETSWVSGLLHEMEHLALGAFTKNVSIRQMIDVETRVWALTCENVLKLFLEYERPLCSSDRCYYSGWIKCGRKADNPRWRRFIAEIYGMVRTK